MDILVKDGNLLNETKSHKDFMIHLANNEVERCMKDTAFLSELKEKKDQFVMNQCFSKGKNLMASVSIPISAVGLLPDDIKYNNQEIIKWIKRYHPYLYFDKI